MRVRIETRPGAGDDGWPTPVYVLVDDHGEVLDYLGWWRTYDEAIAKCRTLGLTRVGPSGDIRE